MKKLVSISAAFSLALGILLVSLFHATSIQYASGIRQGAPLKNYAEGIDIVYSLPYPGPVGPTSPLWPLKAARDRIVLSTKLSPVSRAKQLLLLADKRLASGHHLWEIEQETEALGVLSKSEIYLRQATTLLEGEQVSDETLTLLTEICYSSLKHRQIFEQILAESSDMARPRITEIMNTTKWVYAKTHALLAAEGRTPPSNPFGE